MSLPCSFCLLVRVVGRVGALAVGVTFFLLTLLVDATTVTRDVASPGKLLELGFSIGTRNRPICRLSCGSGRMVGPSGLKLRLGGSPKLVGKFALASTGADAFSRA